MTSAEAVSELGTVLGVWAHPDDEVYLSGGVMALAADAGSRVACVTATRGERGTADPTRWPPEGLAEVRAAELTSCLQELGVTEHYWLGCRDGECSGLVEDEAAARLADLIADIRPRTILTFGPDGMTGHPDHRAVSRWTAHASSRAAPTDARLLFATKSPDWTARFAALFESLGAFLEGGPPQTPEEQLAVKLQLSPPILDRKVAALHAYASQIGPLVSALGDELYRESVAEETFRLATTAEPTGSNARRSHRAEVSNVGSWPRVSTANRKEVDDDRW